MMNKIFLVLNIVSKSNVYSIDVVRNTSLRKFDSIDEEVQ